MAVDVRANMPVMPPPGPYAKAERLQSRSADSGMSSSSRGDAKVVKAGTDFESVLLGSWLQQAEHSFATVPGSDGQDEQDPGKDQLQGIAMQALAGSLTASGGIGIARMITNSLRPHQGSVQSTGVSSAYRVDPTLSGPK